MRTFKELYDTSPPRLKQIVMCQWKAKQNPKWHPEGNSLKHIMVVTERAFTHFEDDIDMILTAYFHDLGKWDTFAISDKTGQPTAYGHENVGAHYVLVFGDWIESLGGNVDKIAWMVKNHMRVKFINDMSENKRRFFMKEQWFEDVSMFNLIDKGGTCKAFEESVSIGFYKDSFWDFKRFINHRVSLRDCQGCSFVGVLDFVGFNYILNRPQVTIDRFVIADPNLDSIKMCPIKEPIFN